MRQPVSQRVVDALTVAVAAVLVTATAGGCAHTVGGTAQRAEGSVPDPDRSYGYVDDRCGLLDDSTVQATLEANNVIRPYSGAVCQYILSRPGAATVDVTFAWFADGSLRRERDVAAGRGADVRDTVIERHQAFSARRDITGAACSATAAAGTGVLSWWVQFRGQKSGDPCVDAVKLLTATLRSDM
ncbi:DUF3558 domain-containing protein [Mycobacterium sp. PSTR-4-N]|uniref:DUF3558 domain-containing protein n=1 Tax=Mycobacterium sp. PSTR-4-N TaxID=2917745 RepID=UPI001F15061A|nr:DUF3558 domain-containing protein [Mycobacterium sp. PSTR-4-N]MCG7595070.1 DUF3558 domain-containing protein [Mycobacterium sp. PSTR-4-N]